MTTLQRTLLPDRPALGCTACLSADELGLSPFLADVPLCAECGTLVHVDILSRAKTLWITGGVWAGAEIEARDALERIRLQAW